MKFIEIDCVEENEDTKQVGYYKAMIDLHELESFIPDWDKEQNEINQTRLFFKSGGMLTANCAYYKFKKMFEETSNQYISFKN